MSLKKYLLAESETKALAGKFEKLCKDIQSSIDDVQKFQDMDSVIETGNINVLAQLNKVKAILGDACKEITSLVSMVSVTEEVPQKKIEKMEDYLTKKD